MKPSPAQALLLRELEPMQAYISADTGRKNLIIRAHGANMASKSYARLSPATVNALVKSGWIIENGSGTYSLRYVISPHGRETLKLLKPEDFIPKRPDFTAKDLEQILFLKYQPPEWIFFTELYAGTGSSSGSSTRMDAWTMNTWPCNNLVKIAFEIKVYRSDFLKELKDPMKRNWALKLSNQFYFVAPKGLISVDELPSECGLMTVNENSELQTTKTAPLRDAKNPPWEFIASLGRDMNMIADRREKEGTP